MNYLLEKIKDYAGAAHGDQRRKFADEPYIAHPVRVMELCSRYTTDLPVLAAALLHDVLEDTDTSGTELRQFLHAVFDKDNAERTAELVEDLTDIYIKKEYPKWNRRKRKNMEAKRMQTVDPDAQTVKYADIIDNSLDLKNAEPDFARLFLFECSTLLKVMEKGNSELHRLAIKTVNECLANLKK